MSERKLQEKPLLFKIIEVWRKYYFFIILISYETFTPRGQIHVAIA